MINAVTQTPSREIHKKGVLESRMSIGSIDVGPLALGTTAHARTFVLHAPVTCVAVQIPVTHALEHSRIDIRESNGTRESAEFVFFLGCKALAR
jgi:hypothetical protein